MKTVDLDHWEDFGSALADLFKQHPKLPSKPMLFRGQSDESWRLQTTLERYPVKLLKLAEYYKAIYKAKPQIETLTSQSWEIPKAYEYAETLKSASVGMGHTHQFPGYEYMIYLRHHGFPSPLLDWTTSPYVAAFFAFNNVISSATRVSIYAYLEYEVAKLTTSDSPHISLQGSYKRSHRRHFLQQCAYTICTVKKEEEGEWQYACHEDVFDKGIEYQDILWKFNLPAIERITALRELDRYNLNGYSLFGTEESLMETVAQRDILFRDRPELP